MFDTKTLKTLINGAVSTARLIANQTATKIDDAVVGALEGTVNSAGFDSLLSLLFGVQAPDPAPNPAPAPSPGPFILTMPQTAGPPGEMFAKLPAGVTEEEIRAKARELGILPALIPVFLQLILKLLGVL